MLVSIIIPVGNVELEKLQSCINNVQNQTLKEIEIILVESSDVQPECVEFMESVVQSDARVKRISGTANAAITCAQGEYIAFVSTEDTADLDFYEKLYEKTTEKKYDIVIGNSTPTMRKEIAIGKPVYRILKDRYRTAIYKADCLREGGVTFGEQGATEEIDFLLRASACARAVASVEETHYQCGKTGNSVDLQSAAADDVVNYCKEMGERMEYMLSHTDVTDPAFAEYIKFEAQNMAKQGQGLADVGIDKNECKISVILPTYNAEEYLPELISTLQNQTLQDIEMIFVDDGSSDNSAAIIKKAMEEDKRISYHYQSNAGAGAARNVGVNHAKGKYFICLDSDDIYDKEMMKSLYDTAEEQTADIVMCYYRMQNFWMNERVEDEGFQADRLPLNTAFAGREIYELFSSFNPRPNNKLYRRKFIIENRLRYGTTRIANDVFFGYSTMLIAERIVCLPKSLLTVRRYVNPNSITSNRKKYLEQSIYAIEQLWDWAAERKILDKDNQRQIVKSFLSATMYNAQYGEHEAFWEECCNFMKKILKAGFNYKTLRGMFTVNPNPTLERIEQLKGQVGTEKEIEMLQNKLAFIEKIGEYVNSLSVESGGVATPRTYFTKAKGASSGSKQTLLLRIKLFLANFWPVTIKRFYNGLQDNKKQIEYVGFMVSMQEQQNKETQNMLKEIREMLEKEKKDK